MEYIKKPIPIHAEQWFPWAPIDCVQSAIVKEGDHSVVLYFIMTLEGDMRVRSGDWIITGILGEKYPCKDEIFRMTYEPANKKIPICP